jgi:hypothetical protein
MRQIQLHFMFEIFHFRIFLIYCTIDKADASCATSASGGSALTMCHAFDITGLDSVSEQCIARYWRFTITTSRSSTIPHT